MSLRDIDDAGRIYDVPTFKRTEDFDRVWHNLTPEQVGAIKSEINNRLDQVLSNPSANWGSITNTSIEGGKLNDDTGIRGDWTHTAYEPIYYAAGSSENQAALFFGSMWKLVIIERRERWIGVRFEPTFPQRGITLQGKTYFPDRGGEM